MNYPSSIKRHRKKQSDTGFVYSTRDRTELSRRTFPAVTAEGDFDLYWIDGSETPEGQVLPDEMCSDTQQLCEIHRGVTGGPDAAIVYGLSYLLDAGYDYIGLLENDVLLAAGWYAVLKRLFSLGKRDGLRVGAATVRTYDKRSLWHQRSFWRWSGHGPFFAQCRRMHSELLPDNDFR